MSNTFTFKNHISSKYAKLKAITNRPPPLENSVNLLTPLTGPNGDSSTVNDSLVRGDFFAASSTTTFPHGGEDGDFNGGDIVDVWGISAG